MSDPLADLVAFARIEVASGDLEPWAEVMAELARRGDVDDEGALWLVKLYNAYDSLSSAWRVFRRWPTPMAWTLAADRDDARLYPCTQERRGLRGGRVLNHLDSYVTVLAGDDQASWLGRPLAGDDPERDFLRLLAYVRRVWGVGRQTAFEWAEFANKVAGLPITAGDAQLWESEGPRRSLQSLYGNPSPTLDWLNERAAECREMLREGGVALSWEDFETVICDFHVMRDGRYYPGRHLAALREEIEEVSEPDRSLLLDVMRTVIPEPWSEIAPGIDRRMMAVYRDTGVIPEPLGV